MASIITTILFARRALLAALWYFWLLTTPLQVVAQTSGADATKWPERPIKIIAPDAPGAGNDVFIRLISPLLSQALGVPVVVDNRPGAGGRIGVEAVFRSAPDGYTLLVGNAGSNGINAAIYQNLPYDLERDFEPLSLLVTGPNVLVVNPRTMPVDGVVGLVEALKRRPGEINFAMTAPGGSAHMMTELFRIRTGTDLVTVPYKGAPDMARGIVSGEVHANFNNLSNILPQIQSGSVRTIAVTSQAQSPLLPGVRTMLEQGITDFEAIAWTALFAPRGTPKAITDKLAAALASLRNVPGLAERVRAQGGQLELSDAMTLRKRVGSDIEKWRTVAQKARITAE
jgi:tripartite-type tricarboxylate transporter receptor subunit TctC